jgi:hypothetical protein
MKPSSFWATAGAAPTNIVRAASANIMRVEMNRDMGQLLAGVGLLRGRQQSVWLERVHRTRARRDGGVKCWQDDAID